MKPEIIQLTRRSFLGAVGAVLLARCGGDDDRAAHPAGTGGSDAGSDAANDALTDGGTLTRFDVWRLLRDAVDASPDNYPARARKLIAEKDPEAIFRFVRDEIRTIPTPSWATTGMRWGARGALRGGAGTPRERAELLSFLYAEAGFETEVVAGFPIDELAASDATTKIHARTIARELVPGPPPAPYDTWEELLGPSPLQPKVIDAQSSESDPLADALIALLPSSATAVPIDVNHTQEPLVKVVVDGEVKYANPLLPDAVFGLPYVQNPLSAGAPDPTPQVKATLTIARSDAPNGRIEVATTTLGLDELVGRQLLVKFCPPQAVDQLLGMNLDQIQMFVPVLGLSAIDLSKAEAEQKSVAGSMITSGGDVIETTNGEVSVNGIPLDQSNIDPNAVQKVASVKLEISAQTFAMIELLVSALDSNGKPVAGLPAGAFSVTEEDAPMQLFLRQNAEDLRVLFLIDETFSQPSQFLVDTERETLGQALGQSLFSAFPGAKCQVQAIGGNLPSASGFTLTDASALAATFKAAWSPTQPYYEWLAQSTNAGASVIVLFTDGVVTEDLAKIPAFKAALATGVPVLCIGTAQQPATIQKTLLEEIATLTSGAYLDAGTLADLTAVNAAISQLLGKRSLAPYRFAYRASKQGPTTRHTSLSVGAAPNATASYAVPATLQPARAICGIHLELQIGFSTIERTLAGWSGPGAPLEALPQSVFDEVRAALFGTAVVSFEGGAPSYSTWLSDLLSAALLGEPIHAAAQSGDVTALADALSKVQSVTIPTELAAVHAALAYPEGTSVFEQGPRVVLLQLQPNEKANRKLDILPFTRFATFGGDDASRFRTTLRASTRLAVMERALFQTSTVSELAQKPLTLLAPFGVDDSALSAFPQKERAPFHALLDRYWNYHRAIATDGSTRAFFAIDADTGSVLGILPDGSGGGSSGGCKDIGDAGKYFELLELLNEILSLPGASLWLVLGKFVAVAALEAAMCFTDGPVPPGFGDPSALPCAFLEAGLGEAIGKAVPELSNKALDFLKNYGTDKVAGAAANCPPLIPKC